ncbi:hypothetical protein JCM33374_g1885 [Metschnikowia sp. JCM 33374]|nr:hypothetical protein JCM33374_g1885 [Metschnikowia sp. JCM 33374]
MDTRNCKEIYRAASKNSLSFAKGGDLSCPTIKRALASAKKQENSAKNQPESIEEFIEEGAIDEESGDRWHSSDLAKALRFYQKAFDEYKSAARMGTADEKKSLQLAYYNGSRLLFHVYTQYQRTDGVQISDLKNVGEVIDAGENSVIQEIHEIIKAHESCVEFAGDDAPTDLLFNTAMVYMDAVEDTETPEDAYRMVDRSMGLLKEILRRQVSELKILSQGMALPQEGDEEAEPTSPSDLIDTVVSAFNLAQTLYEAVGTSAQDIETASSLMGELTRDADEVATQVFDGSFSEDGTSSITDEQKEEYLVAKAYVSAASCSNLEGMVAAWDDPALPESPERYMSAADCIDSFMQRSGISSGPNIDSESYWMGLNKMNQYFKLAQELLTARLQTVRANAVASQAMGIGSIVSQIAKVYIARSDIDLQRSQLPLEQAVKNSALLVNNAKAFLKNAMNLAKQTGGMREKAVEKIQREKRRIEAVCRLCVLEGKTQETELDSIVGVGRWQIEIDGLRDLWYFSIEQPSVQY